ncbi:unannotated protein [freshwater metagenome]|uniref:Unannotated protein n=1 Tax=freshwater metagenome TaxID=449393 RepID=A0A6J6BPX7_9ZZZZ
MRHLPSRMNACICSASNGQTQRSLDPQYRRKGSFNFALDGAQIAALLNGPSREVRSVIGQVQAHTNKPANSLRSSGLIHDVW